jgi:hypothetical protein
MELLESLYGLGVWMFESIVIIECYSILLMLQIFIIRLKLGVTPVLGATDIVSLSSATDISLLLS